MTETTRQLNLEPRWPMVLTFIVVFASTLLPGRVRIFPPWVVVLITIVLILPMAGLWLSPAKQRWLRIESVVITVFVLVAGVGMIIDLKDVFVKMVTPPSGLTGIQLLNSSISMWATNVLIFSVVYWRLDRGGNEARAEGTPGTQDWHFPRQDAEDGSKWRPTYVDYLFLAFCTATAFSPAEAMPMTSRAKMMLMAESLISLVTVMAIVSRAIGLLGS